MQEARETIAQKIQEAEMVLVGLGERFTGEGSAAPIKKAYENLAELLQEKDYFVITLAADELIYGPGLRRERIVRPLALQEDESGGSEKVEGTDESGDSENAGGTDESEGSDGAFPEWDAYMRWLQGTLRKKLLVLELGVGLTVPQMIRFPFEKIVYLNEKAELVRVHDRLFQLPENLHGKGLSVPKDALWLLAGDEG